MTKKEIMEENTIKIAHDTTATELVEYYEECPNCGSEAVGCDETGSVPFLECFQCDHNWIP